MALLPVYFACVLCLITAWMYPGSPTDGGGNNYIPHSSEFQLQATGNKYDDEGNWVDDYIHISLQLVAISFALTIWVPAVDSRPEAQEYLALGLFQFVLFTGILYLFAVRMHPGYTNPGFYFPHIFNNVNSQNLLFVLLYAWTAPFLFLTLFIVSLQQSCGTLDPQHVKRLVNAQECRGIDFCMTTLACGATMPSVVVLTKLMMGARRTVNGATNLAVASTEG
ncbi:MAG: hypothetical protein M1840_006457 [Geoglossum simile]|nr:MAG: hypothetical protein M1840_006457 [Geoglossum simile]